jgi:hypothetical protein
MSYPGDIVWFFQSRFSTGYCVFQTQPTALKALIGLYQVGVGKDFNLGFPLGCCRVKHKELDSSPLNPHLCCEDLKRHCRMPIFSILGKSGNQASSCSVDPPVADRASSST